MIISRETENELKKEQYVKPKLSLDDFYFKWNEHSLGILENETKEFEHFLKNSIPFLNDLLRQLRITEKALSKNIHLDTFLLDTDVFTPMVKLQRISEHGKFTSSFILQFASDGAIFVDREEDLMIAHKDENGFYSSPLHLRWELGSLHNQYPEFK